MEVEFDRFDKVAGAYINTNTCILKYSKCWWRVTHLTIVSDMTIPRALLGALLTTKATPGFLVGKRVLQRLIANKHHRPSFAKQGSCCTANELSTHEHCFLDLVQCIWDHPDAILLESSLKKELKFGKCTLASDLHPIRSRYARLFAAIFNSTIGSMTMNGFQTDLSRHDLFHGHLFRTSVDDLDNTSVVGMLFHCYEYPLGDEIILPRLNLGHCQVDSDCSPSLEEWRYRNVLWAAWWSSELGDANQGCWLLDGKAPEIAGLRMDATQFGVDCPNTVWEGYLGEPVADIYLLDGELYASSLDQ